MSVERKVVATSSYRASHIAVRHMGPDLLCYVDGAELSGFFLNIPAAIAGGQRYIDQQIKEQEGKK